MLLIVNGVLTGYCVCFTRWMSCCYVQGRTSPLDKVVVEKMDAAFAAPGNPLHVQLATLVIHTRATVPPYSVASLADAWGT